MKRNSGNSKKKNKGNKRSLNRKKSASIRGRKRSEELKLQMQRRCRKERRDSVEPKQESVESVVRAKLPKFVITTFGLVSVFEPISSRNR